MQRVAPSGDKDVREIARHLREEYGVYVNHVAPVLSRGRKVWAIGTRVYPDRPPNETFHEFILLVLREVLGEGWRASQQTLPEADRHFVFKCFEQWTRFKRLRTDPEELARNGRTGADANGWTRYLFSLAWDVASLIHADELPGEVLDRLRDHVQYQGARYEIAIAAIFARFDCSIRWLDVDPTLRGRPHVEFVATHRPTRQRFAVEAKSRHRTGVLNRPGEPDAGDPLRGDKRGVQTLFRNAVAKAPGGMPYFIFLDINAPPESDWEPSVKKWMDRRLTQRPEELNAFNTTYVTNFSPHYDGDDVSVRNECAEIHSRRPRVPMMFDVRPALTQALRAYGKVPAFDLDGSLLE